MSMSKPCAAPPDRRVAPAVAASNAGVLHPDAVYEILLRLPAKELCRLCAVCRPWRSLLSDPHFIAAHSARHPGPLIVAAHDTIYRDDVVLFDIMDLSGQVVKRVRSTCPTAGRGKERVTSIQLHLVCIAEKTGRSGRLLDPATGSVCALPEGFPEEVNSWYSGSYNALFAFGQVGSTGVYKVLRVLTNYHPVSDPPLYEVYLLAALLEKHEQDRIAYFDLETEEWSPSILGPLSRLADNHIDDNNLSLAQLSGCLVMVYQTVSSSLDLWFLMDFEKGLWVKQYSLQVNLSDRHSEYYLHPLLVLNDGRIVTYLVDRGILRIYDPSTSNYTEVQMNRFVSVGLYTGSLLSLASSAN